MVIKSDHTFYICSLYRECLACHFLLSAHGSRKSRDLLGIAVIYTFEILTTADRPVDRTGTDTQDIFNLIHQFKWISGFPVHLVDEGKNRDLSHDTDLKQLDGLCLNTLRTIDHHDRTVCSHQGTIRILREILMSRSVQDVNAVTVIIKLHNGRSNRNTSLLLDLHPVGNCVLRCFSSLYGTC